LILQNCDQHDAENPMRRQVPRNIRHAFLVLSGNNTAIFLRRFDTEQYCPDTSVKDIEFKLPQNGHALVLAQATVLDPDFWQKLY